MHVSEINRSGVNAPPLERNCHENSFRHLRPGMSKANSAPDCHLTISAQALVKTMHTTTC